MADSYPPGTSYDLVKFAEAGKINARDRWLHIQVPEDLALPFTWFALTADEEKSAAAALPKPAPVGNSATTTARLNARDLPRLIDSVILRELPQGQQIVLGDSAPVHEAVSDITWRFITWPLRAWVSEKYLAFAVVQPPPPPVLTGDMGVCIVASGDGSDARQLTEIVTGLRNKGKVLASACVVQNAGLANALLGMSPQTFLAYRYIPMAGIPGGVEEIGPGHPSINYDARKMWDLCWPELAKVPNAARYQMDNESDPEDIEGFRKWCKYVSDLIDIADAHPAKPRLTLFNFGVGHPKYEQPEFKAALDPVMRKAAKRHFIDVHCYSPTLDKDPAGPTDIEASAEWFAFRIERLMDAVPDALFVADEYGLANGRYPGREVYQANVGKFRARMQKRKRFLCFNSWMIPERPNEPGVWQWEGHGVPPQDFIEIA